MADEDNFEQYLIKAKDQAKGGPLGEPDSDMYRVWRDALRMYREAKEEPDPSEAGKKSGAAQGAAIGAVTPGLGIGAGAGYTGWTVENIYDISEVVGEVAQAAASPVGLEGPAKTAAEIGTQVGIVGYPALKGFDFGVNSEKLSKYGALIGGPLGGSIGGKWGKIKGSLSGSSEDEGATSDDLESEAEILDQEEP